MRLSLALLVCGKTVQYRTMARQAEHTHSLRKWDDTNPSNSQAAALLLYLLCVPDGRCTLYPYPLPALPLGRTGDNPRNHPGNRQQKRR